MTWDRSSKLWIALGLVVACRSPDREQPAAEPAPEPTRPVVVQHGGETVDTLALAADASVELWRLCDRAGVETVVARGATGSFVHAACRLRGKRGLELRWDGAGDPVVELSSGPGGRNPVARAAGVSEILLLGAAPAAEARPAPASLRVVVEGGRARVIEPGAIEAAAGHAGQRGADRGERKAGASLVAVLEGAGLDVADVESLTVEGQGERYELTGKRLRAADGWLSLRYNRKGLLRFGHRIGDRELGKIRGVEAVTVRLR